MNDKLDEQWTLHSIIEYISENFIGLTLLVLAFFIIYVVDHINNLNSIMMSQQIYVPQISSSKISNQMKVKSKKLKNR